MWREIDYRSESPCAEAVGPTDDMNSLSVYCNAEHMNTIIAVNREQDGDGADGGGGINKQASHKRVHKMKAF